MAYIAGHTFAATPSGRRCTSTVYRDGGQVVCDRAWRDICDADDSDVGKLNIAHSGGLSANELAEIRAEKQAEQDRIWNAVAGVAGRSS